jgi:2,3-diketo-5-methylthio-1-phosphopentane phosphatase
VALACRRCPARRFLCVTCFADRAARLLLAVMRMLPLVAPLRGARALGGARLPPPRPPPAVAPRVAAGHVAQGRPTHLFVFDFDHTIISCDSDECVLAKFGGGIHAVRARLEAAGAQGRWAPSVFAEIGRLQQAGVTREQMEDELRSIEIDASLRRALQKLAARPDTELRILSDANTWFIDTILQANGLAGVFRETVSNRARLVVRCLLRCPR